MHIYVFPPRIASKCCRWVCNKGAALTVLTQHLGLSLRDCMAFGDAMNDREMLGSVGSGFIMGNAMPQLRAELRIYR